MLSPLQGLEKRNMDQVFFNEGREVRNVRIGNMERSVRRDQLPEYIYKRILKRSRAQPTDFIYKRIL